jgi:hypothetical protein
MTKIIKIKDLMKKPSSIVIVISIFLLLLSIITVNLISSEVDFAKFDWDGVSGVSDVLMTFVTLILMLSIWQAKDAHDESTKARVQSTNASDAEVLRWAMDEMGERKKHIKLVTNEFKKELEKMLISNYSFTVSGKDEELADCIRPHKYQLTNIKSQPKHTDQERMSHILNMKKYDQDKFYSDVEKITGRDWDQDIKDVLHKEVSIIMQRMGYMALFGLISKQHFINLWGPMFLASWYSIEWYIREEREKLCENLDPDNNYPPEMFIERFGTGGDKDNRDYQGAFFRIHLETFIRECETKLPLALVNNERLKFGRKPFSV